MKTMRFISTGLFVVLMGCAATGQAEDIDIYSGSTSNGVPNLMFVVDNGANSNANMGACTYWDGAAPSMGSKALGNYQCAFANIVHTLSTRNGSAVVNLGIVGMNGVAMPLTPIDDNPYPAAIAGDVTRTYGSNPDDVTYTIPQGSTNRQAFIIGVKALNIVQGQVAQGAELQETWAYYTGGNGGSTGTGILTGTAHPGTDAVTGCMKNYLIFLSGVSPSSHATEDSSHLELPRLLSATTNAVADDILTAAQKTRLDAPILPALENGYAREWARFMRAADINTSAAGTGLQSIVSYSIATGDTAVPITDGMEKYIKAVATYGGGKYYPAGNDINALTSSILKILNEVQAVNSVFSSASLPVSVNAQGTYLNQIYMGMFRPDQEGNPRWVGNLKQYKFVATRDPDTHLVNLFLGDSLGASAINPATGFINPNAVSYWTCGGSPSVRACSPVADLASGFWVNDPVNSDSVGGAYDLPDGEFVDKGGAAQIVRLANLTNNYATAAGTSTNPRKLYTCTGACASGNELSVFPFANSNANLTAAAFGIITPQTITSLTRSGATATVVAAAHGVADGQVVEVSGANQSEYNGSYVMTYVNANTLTYTMNVAPAATATGTITASVPPAGVAISSLTRVGSTVTVTAAAGHSLTSGDSAIISGVTPSDYNGTWTVSCGAVGTSCEGIAFTFTGPAEGPVTPSGGGTAAVPGKTTRSIDSAAANPAPGLQRSGTTVTVKTTANHGFVTGDSVTIAGAGDGGYNAASRPITVTGVKTFTYTLPCTTPCTPATVPGTVTKATGSSVVIDSLTRTLGAGAAATATATTTSDLRDAPYGLTVGGSYSINISGATQVQYNGTYNATLASATAGGSTFTYAITTAPATTATGTLTLGSSLATADMINWVRGYENVGDENGPGGSVTIRPSLHGDVLHSRPVTINYGGTIGVVVFYGGNDGVYRAVNGNQTNPAGSALPVPGSELWGFIPSEFFSKLKRQHDNSPILELDSTIPGISPTPQRKDYFADGSTGVYQKLNADGTTNTAYIYVSMRRGGKLVYALDVTDPTNPKYLWKITNTGDFTELGQTWSAPKVTAVKGYMDGSTPKPVLIFGAGYDTAEDTEPPGAKSMGRGIYVVDAVTGAMIWRVTDGASNACSGNATKASCTVTDMDFSIPADITQVDRDHDGMIDRMYAADVGGNVWRVDMQRSAVNYTPDYWRVNKVASLGGSCCPRRKFFYPPDVVTTNSYDAVLVGSGDREHPLYANAAADKQDRFFMLKDLTGNDGSSLTTIVKGDLFNATSIDYRASAVGFNGTTSPNKGYYIDLREGEKVVNAPLTVAGYTYFGTNQPTASNTCSANLGIARGYRLKPLSGAYTSVEYAGGGLPPSPVGGVVEVTAEGESTSSLVAFIIGGGGRPPEEGEPPGCDSALGACRPDINVSTSRRRTYWYRQTD